MDERPPVAEFDHFRLCFIHLCASAIMVGALNTRGSFFGQFFTILLNLSMISTLALFGLGLGWSGLGLATVLA